MNIIENLATTLKRRDEVPNQLLAEKIAKSGNSSAVNELIELLGHKSKDIQHDAIKVLYEIGERKPGLITRHFKVFLALLKHRNNRLQWGGMTALASLVDENPQGIYSSLPDIISAAESGSVITRDYAMKILTSLYGKPHYQNDVFPLFIEQLMRCPANQLPMYAENILPFIATHQATAFMTVLRSRLDDMEKESKRKRVEKVIRNLEKKDLTLP